MKRNFFTFVLTLFFAVMLSAPAYSGNENTNPTEIIVNNENLSEEEKASLLMDRLDEIKNMNLTEMPRSERKAVRKEVKQIKKSMADIGGGVYLSGAAIIIILLIIIIVT